MESTATRVQSLKVAETRVRRVTESATTPAQPLVLESAATRIQPPELESATTRIQPLELESVIG